ncbi:secondary thiamine-phosphate synthase enzyme YjbQ [Geobacter sp. DSM 9736]|uniref:secondary thiamine-phosphate synthase enzyme YjbQ n=1 Tax=Geobacter sp. DSM 9736 TaxID=1277350 RepID=UPI000B5089AD|nr:secondary thiamine-phosphate synthase enzyme YjbQ [Geobacter sp. DSM 9736]SNB47742.1 secondary thiamine-phosphate synthase enzyme [Geobacter sp. DSM 9736]
MIKYIDVKTRTRTEMIDITSQVQEIVRNSGVRSGVCHLFVLHTTAGITINEGADPAVQRDMVAFLNKLVPHDPYFTHREGNSDAHIKSSLVGTSQNILIESSKPVLGTWQAVYFCEFDGPRQRKVAVKIVADD